MTNNPFIKKPIYLMAKPVGSKCNLNCAYCYYLEKGKFYYNSLNHSVMSDSILEQFIEQYILSQFSDNVLFTWHGGEPLLLPIEYYKKIIKLQKKHSNGKTIDNCIQTNATLINDEWCRFFKENGWLVGVSIDGPQHFHDKYRQNTNGNGSFNKVIDAINLLNKWHVDWNAMAVINRYNANYPIDFYNFFKQIGCHYIQFTPCVERIINEGNTTRLANASDKQECQIADFSVTPEQWGNFLCSVFDEWITCDVGEYFIQTFDATLANWVGVNPGVCSLSHSCGNAGIIEHNGDIYACDHFVFPKYKLGNIRDNSIIEIMYGSKEIDFGQSKHTTLPLKCKQCKYLFACNGECPRNRFAYTDDGETGLNYLCNGYYKFFSHIEPFMEFMKNEHNSGMEPANIMQSNLVKDLRNNLK